MAEENSQPIDYQELEFKKRARRRLVGSVALVLLMIVVLPMILKDKHPEPLNQNLVISIPSESDSATTPPAIQADQNITPENTTPSSTTENQAEVAITDKSANAPVQEFQSSATNSLAPLNIQIGVFADAKNTAQLQSKLESNGFSVQSQTFSNGKIRLRVGPYASREEAELALSKLKSFKLNPMIVND